jgi:hypothetical protein
MHRTNRIRFSLFVYFLTLYIVTIQGIQSGDNVFHYERTQNILKNHSFSMPEGRYNFNKKPWLRSWMKEGKDGRIYLILPDGLSIASIPFSFLGNFIEKTGNYDEYRKKINEAWESNQPGKMIYYLNKLPSSFFSVVMNSFLLALTIIIFFNFCYLLTNSLKKAFVSSILLGNATILWVYSSNFWTQPIVTFCMFSAFYFLFSFSREDNIKYLLLAGFFAGYSYISRYASLLSLPFFIFYLISLRWKEKKAIVKNLVFFSIPLFIILFIQMYWNFYRFGSSFDLGFNRLFLSSKFLIPYLTSFLFSLSRSILVFSPTLILGIFGLKKFFKEQKLEFLIIAGIPSIFLIFYSLFGFGISITGTAWGPRYLVPITPFLLLPVCLFVDEVKWRKMLTYLALTTGFFIQLIMVLQPLQGVAISKYYGDLKGVIGMPFLRTEIIPQAKRLVKGGFHLWMFDSVHKLIIGLILLGISLYSLFYCIYVIRKTKDVKTIST